MTADRLWGHASRRAEAAGAPNGAVATVHDPPYPSGHRASVLGRIERCCAYMRTTRRTLSLSARPWPARARTLKLSRVCCVPKSQNLNRGRDVLHRGRGLPGRIPAHPQRPTTKHQRATSERATTNVRASAAWAVARCVGVSLCGSALPGVRQGGGFETSNARRYRFRNFRRRRTCRLNAERTFSQ